MVRAHEAANNRGSHDAFHCEAAECSNEVELAGMNSVGLTVTFQSQNADLKSSLLCGSCAEWFNDSGVWFLPKSIPDPPFGKSLLNDVYRQSCTQAVNHPIPFSRG